MKLSSLLETDTRKLQLSFLDMLDDLGIDAVVGKDAIGDFVTGVTDKQIKLKLYVDINLEAAKILLNRFILHKTLPANTLVSFTIDVISVAKTDIDIGFTLPDVCHVDVSSIHMTNPFVTVDHRYSGFISHDTLYKILNEKSKISAIAYFSSHTIKR